MKPVFYSVLFSLLFMRCQPQKSNNEQKVDVYHDSILYTINRPSGQIDSIVAFNSHFESVCLNGMNLIEYLLTYENDFSTKKDIVIKGERKQTCLCFTDNRISYYVKTMVPITNNSICALYLISAIYYNNYYFASDIVLYDNDKIKYDTTRDKYYKYYVGNSDYTENYFDSLNMNYQTQQHDLERAWKAVNEWYKRNKNHSLEEIRKHKDRPLHNTSLYWYGEDGGKANENYPHTFDKYYCRTVKCDSLRR
jgi:hypothetical protein